MCHNEAFRRLTSPLVLRNESPRAWKKCEGDDCLEEMASWRAGRTSKPRVDYKEGEWFTGECSSVIRGFGVDRNEWTRFLSPCLLTVLYEWLYANRGIVGGIQLLQMILERLWIKGKKRKIKELAVWLCTSVKRILEKHATECAKCGSCKMQQEAEVSHQCFLEKLWCLELDVKQGAAAVTEWLREFTVGILNEIYCFWMTARKSFAI